MVLIAPLLVIMAGMMLIGLSRANDYSVGALLTSIGNWFKNPALAAIPILGSIANTIGDGILSLDNVIRRAIGDGIEAFAPEVATLFTRISVVAEDVGQAAADVGRSTEAALLRILRASVPALIAAKLASLAAQVHVGNTVTHYIEKTLPGKVERVAAITKVYPVTIERVAGLPALVHAAVASAIAAAGLPHAIPRTGDITSGIESLWDQIKRIGKYGTVAGIAGLVGATVFSHFGLGWLRCSNVNKAGKALCGFNTSRLEALLAGLAVFLGTLDLVAFAGEVKAITGTVEGEVRTFWRANVTGPSHDRALGSTGL